ncbi:MAG: protein kinase [Opitutaceae bacterium]
MIPGNIANLAPKEAHPSPESTPKPTSLGARVKHFLGLDQPARSKGTTAVAIATAKPLHQRELSVGLPPAPRTRQVDPNDPNLAFKPVERVALFLAQQMQQDNWDKPKEWQGALEKQLVDLYRQPAALSEAEREALKHPEVLLKYLASRALDAAPPGEEATVSARLGQLVTSGALKDGHSQAMIQLGDLKAQLLAQHTALEPLRIRDKGIETTVTEAKQALKTGGPSPLTATEVTALESRQPDDLTIDDLPPSIRQSEAFQAFLGDLAKKVMTTHHLYSELPTDWMGDELNKVLSLTDAEGNPELRMPMAFSLSDGKAFMNSLVEAAKAHLPSHDHAAYQEKANRLSRNNQFQEIFARAKIDLVDKIDKDGVLWLGKVPHLPAATLGSGASGVVRLYQKAIPDPRHPTKLIPDPSDPGLAVKFAHGDDQTTGPTEESKVLANAVGSGSNENIAPPRASFVTKLHGRVIVLPMAKHGSLNHVFSISFDSAMNRGFPAKASIAAAFLAPLVGLARAVIGLDLAKSIAHRDIALRNVLVTADGKGKLADFGISTTLVGTTPENASKSVSGEHVPLRWSPPEQYKADAVLTSKANTWMFGMALYEAVYGTPPLQRDGDGLLRGEALNIEIAQRVLAFDPAKDLPAVDSNRWPSPMDQKLHALLTAILKPKPEDRPSMVEVEQSLRDIMKISGLGVDDSGKLLDVLLSHTPPELSQLAQDMAQTALQPSDTWRQGIITSLVAAYTNDEVKYTDNPNLITLLSSPETTLKALMVNAVESVPADQQEAVWKTLQSPEFQSIFVKAFTATYPLRPIELTPHEYSPSGTTPVTTRVRGTDSNSEPFYSASGNQTGQNTTRSDATPFANVSFETTGDEQVAPSDAPIEEHELTPSNEVASQDLSQPPPTSTETNAYASLSSLRDKADGYGSTTPITELKPGLSKEENPYSTARTIEARNRGYGKAKPITELGKTPGATDET